MVILGLGSNIGDRMQYLAAAVRRLSGMLQEMHMSRILESPAMLPPDASADMDRPYLNMAVSGKTDLTPQALLTEVKSLERELGRVQRSVWGPREIDIDILAMDGLVTQSPELTVPHRGILKRDFALLPLSDVAPDWKYPVAGSYYNMPVSEILAAKGYAIGNNLRDTGLTIDL